MTPGRKLWCLYKCELCIPVALILNAKSRSLRKDRLAMDEVYLIDAKCPPMSNCCIIACNRCNEMIGYDWHMNTLMNV